MKSKNRVIKYLIAAWVMLYAIPCSSSVAFYHYGIDNGLPETNIISIAQDSIGFIWLAGESTLFRFDGHRFKQYRNDTNNPEESMLPARKINTIFTDSRGRLWVGSENGIAYYDFYRDRFIGPLNGWKNIWVSDFSEDNQGNLWIGTSAGLAKLNPESRETIWYTAKNKAPTEGNNILPNQYIMQINWQSENKIWLATYPGGLFCLNPQKKEVTSYENYNEFEFENYKITELRNKGNNIYVSTVSNGFFKIEPEINKARRFTFDHLGYNVHHFAFEQDSIIWLTTNNGLLKFNQETGKFIRYTNIPNDPLSLERTSVNHVFIDRDKNLWTSLGIRGISYGLRNVPFNHFIVGEGAYSLFQKEVTAILFDFGRNMWLGYESGLVEKHSYDPLKKQQFPLADGSPNKNPGAVFSIYEDSEKRVWLGGWQTGLQKLNATGSSFEKCEIISDAYQDKMETADIRDIIEGPGGNIWLSVHGLGVGKYNPDTKNIQFFRFNSENPALGISNDYTFNLCLDKNKNLWISSSYGVTRLDISSEKFTTFVHQEGNPASLSDNTVNTVFCDSEGLVWAGTANGLNVFLPGDDTFTPILPKQNTSFRKISSIEQSKPGEIWASTQSGLMKINYSRETGQDSIHCSAAYFDRSDGLVSTHYFDGSSASETEGSVFFGGNEGIDMYIPGLAANFLDAQPQTLITEISIYGKSVYHKVKKPDSGLPSLTLTHDQQMISFRFTSIDFNNSGEQKYRYMLEGFDKQWLYPQNEQVATYTNLSAGDYIFRVQSQTKESNWGTEEDAISLTVRPPFWATIPFIIFAAVFIISILYFLYRLRNRYTLARQQELEEIINRRTQELQEKNKELENANKTKNKFFSIISHDLRGPFSALLGLLEILAEPECQINQKKQQELIKTAKQSAQNTFNLLENLLIWSRTQMKKTTYAPKINDISKLLNKNTELNKELFQQKDIDLQTQIPEKLEGYFDIDMIDTVIRNILSNAIKFTHRRENIKIVAEELNGKEIVVQVADSGIGLTPEETQNLFDIGKNSKNGTSGEKGTGLGLIICKEFVEQNKGRIWASPNKPEGTVFCFTLPAGKD